MQSHETGHINDERSLLVNDRMTKQTIFGNIVFRSTVTLAVVVILLGIVAVPITYMILSIRTRNNKSKITCYSMCQNNKQSATAPPIDCWCSLPHQTSLKRVENICSSRYKNEAEKCFSMNAGGCPELINHKIISSCPLFGNTTSAKEDSKCVLEPLLYQYMPEKYLIDGDELDYVNYLSNASKAILYQETENFHKLTSSFVENLRITSSLIDNETVSFTSDFQSESEESQYYYFSFMWKDPPMFRPVLPDNDTRLTPSYLINTPARIAWKESVINKILSEGVPVTGRKPRFYFLGGGPGSGKTTIVRMLYKQGVLKQNETVYINSDDIKVLDPIFINLTSIGEYRAAQVVHKDSSDMANVILDRAITSGFDIILDAVMGSLDKAQKIIDRLVASGYDISVIGITVDCDIAIQRASARAVKSMRYVPANVIIEGHDNFSKYFPIYAHVITSVLLFENNGVAPVLIGKRDRNETLFQVLDDQQYTRFLQKIYLNIDADNIFELYTNPCAELERIKETLKGSCASSVSDVERYMRIYLMLSNYNRKRNSNSVCVCAPRSTTGPAVEDYNRYSMNSYSDDPIVTAITAVDAWREIVTAK